MGILDEYETIAAKHDLARHNGGGLISLGDAIGKTLNREGPIRQFELAISLVPDNLRESTKLSFERALAVCESPIEKLLLPWILCQEYSFFRHMPLVLLPGESEILPPRSLALVPQLPIGKYRVDFALAASRGGPIRFVIIECDGKEYHEDVHRDIKRDARLLWHRQVLDIIPLSGKEIWRDPEAAAAEVAKAFSWAWSKNNKNTVDKFA
jgi:very-short-patch-repair endonuclease